GDPRLARPLRPAPPHRPRDAASVGLRLGHRRSGVLDALSPVGTPSQALETEHPGDTEAQRFGCSLCLCGYSFTFTATFTGTLELVPQVLVRHLVVELHLGGLDLGAQRL